MNERRPLAGSEPLLTDGFVVLRRWALDDVGCIVAASSDPRITEITTVPSEPGRDAARAFIERQWSRLVSGEGISLAIATGTEPACGCATLMHRGGQQRGVSSLGYWIEPARRGSGIASRAIGLLVAWALEQPQISRVEALVEPDNLASQRVVERAGLIREGRLRSFLAIGERRADADMYARIRDM